jgi:peptidyl-prolyl cis-trans isomerase A (cyclophilin A)
MHLLKTIDLRKMRSFWTRTLLGMVMLVAAGAGAQTNGIFADFTTSLGSFTCQLSYSNSPAAVANFIGLVTGERPWLDLPTGEMRTTPFYNGLTFHRVIAGFMNQGGSPNGQGSDGPGYTFADQFNPLLTFGTPWILAMANSGPDSNGSQFFTTVAPYTSGNNSYVIFGRVVSGTNVVAAINKVATDSNDKPLTNVVIQQVTIRRVGAAAEAFDINAQALPIVTNTPLNLAPSTSSLSVTFSNRLYADNRWYSSTNLSEWTSNSLGIEISTPATNSLQVATDAPQKFFRLAQILYPSSTFAPKNVLGRTLTMVFTGVGTNTIVFDTNGGGTYNFTSVGSGSVTNYIWSQDPYRGLLWPIQYSGLNEMTLSLNFSSSTNGSFSGTVYSSFPFSVSGAFKLK